MTRNDSPRSLRRTALAVAAVAPFILLGACSAMGMGGAMEADNVLGARLTGIVEVPGPGDSDGRGVAAVRFDPAMPTRLCYELSVSGIAPASAAHIHRGAAGVAGPVAVMLAAPTDGSSEGCVDVAAALVAEIMGSPDSFYVCLLYTSPSPRDS